MQDFLRASQGVGIIQDQANALEGYLGHIRELMEACDAAEKVAEEITVGGETFVRLPVSEWTDIKTTLCRAW